MSGGLGCCSACCRPLAIIWWFPLRSYSEKGSQCGSKQTPAQLALRWDPQSVPGASGAAGRALRLVLRAPLSGNPMSWERALLLVTSEGS